MLGEAVLERDAASTPEYVLVASKGDSWMGAFLVFEEIVVTADKLKHAQELVADFHSAYPNKPGPTLL